jgi:hypothetical protein
MKKVLSVCLILMLVATTSCTKHVINGSKKPKFLYVLSAKSGVLDGKTLTLKDVPLVIYFSDRPDRVAGHMSLKKFVKMWGEGPDSFKIDPPNASLSILNAGEKTAVVELVGVPEFKGNSVTFKIKVISGTLPNSLPALSLFIDFRIADDLH